MQIMWISTKFRVFSFSGTFPICVRTRPPLLNTEKGTSFLKRLELSLLKYVNTSHFYTRIGWYYFSCPPYICCLHMQVRMNNTITSTRARLGLRGPRVSNCHLLEEEVKGSRTLLSLGGVFVSPQLKLLNGSDTGMCSDTADARTYAPRQQQH